MPLDSFKRMMTYIFFIPVAGCVMLLAKWIVFLVY